MKKFIKIVCAAVIFSNYSLFGHLKEALVSESERQIAKVFQEVEGQGILEITQALIDSPQTSSEIKQKIIQQKRRIFLFEYPSEEFQIKGYISFVPDCEIEPLCVFLRGGVDLFGMRHPADESSFLGNCTVIGTTYRGGVNQGCDEFGGRDVQDVKHLIDYIPILEEKLGISITESKKFLIGASRGGMEMFLALQRFPELQTYFDRAVSISGILDIEQFFDHRPEFLQLAQYILNLPGDSVWMQERNPMRHVENFSIDLPILLLQGTEDPLIHIMQGVAMSKMLQTKGCLVDYIEIEGGNHCLHNVDTCYELILEWLSR